MEEKPVRPYFALQLVLEVSARYYVLLMVVLIICWGSKKWYFDFASVVLLVCETVRLFSAYRGNLQISLQWSLAAIAFGVFPVLPAEIALLASQDEAAAVKAVLGVHIALVIVAMVLGVVGVSRSVTAYRLTHL